MKVNLVLFSPSLLGCGRCKWRQSEGVPGNLEAEREKQGIVRIGSESQLSVTPLVWERDDEYSLFLHTSGPDLWNDNRCRRAAVYVGCESISKICNETSMDGTLFVILRGRNGR